MAELEDLLGPYTFPLDDPSSRTVRLEGGTEGGDQRSRADDLDDEDEDGGEVGRGRLSAERRAKRKAQRENRQLQRALEEQNERLAQLESTVTETRVADARGSLEARRAAARERLKAAKDDQDSDAEVAALEELSEANRQLKELEGSVRAAREQQAAGAGSPAAKRPNRALEAWKEKNDWFNDDFGDFKSGAAGMISTQLLREGYAADDPAHFRELDRRLRKELPQHFGGGRRAAPREDDPDDDDLDVPGTTGRGRLPSRGDDRDAEERTYNQAQIRIWKTHVKPDFDPRNAEHVADFRKYHDEVHAKNSRRARRG